jgi:chromosome segregation ATPase
MDEPRFAAAYSQGTLRSKALVEATHRRDRSTVTTDDVYAAIVSLKDANELFASRVETRFNAIDQRFDAMDRRFDGMDKRLDGMDKRLDGMDKRLDGMDQRLDRMYGRLGRLETRVEDVETAVVAVRVEMSRSKRKKR